MATRAVFVGINEYADIELDNLEGARLDATALHALFMDSVPNIDAHLLVDRDATRAAVHACLIKVLDGAGPDDVVVVTFSGHGSADAGLVLHDSAVADLATMISMDEIALRFRQTKARCVLVLLDCCESGEGPRRVLNSWTASDGIDEAILAASGGGRVMIAAANPVQFAFESAAVAGHGLLSASLMDVLTKADAPVDVRVLSAAISERVRAEAARLGETQTPVDVSIVAGGFALPPLRPGDRFRAEFPDRSAAAVSRIRDLEAYGIPDSVLDIWEKAYPGGLNDLQLKAINDYRILDGENVLAVAPTGSGKTLLGELAAIQKISRGRRAVFLVPLRALAAEKHEEFLERYGEPLGLRVIRCVGDQPDQVPEFLHGKYDLALLTYEMFLGLVLAKPSALAHLGTVVIDEAHFITDGERGINVELLMTLLVTARERGTAPQVVALSAVIGKINHFDEWFGARCLVHASRPVPLVEGVIDRSGRYRCVDVDGTEKVVQLVPAREIRQRGPKESAQDVVVPLVRTLLSAGETVIVFRGTKGEAAGAAGYLARDLGLPAASDALNGLLAVSASSDSDRLRACLGQGTAFHNSNLIRQERAIVERAFRDGELRVLTSTTTLAAGINTPATTVIIVEHSFRGDPPRDLYVSEYKNMAGRAGRPGFAPVGRAILYAENQLERDRLFRTYVRGEPEGIRSSFDPSDLDTWLIRLLRQVKRIPADKVISLLAGTFGGYTLVRRDPSWQARMERELQERLTRMRALGLVEDVRGFVVLTRLGEACGQSSLSLGSCMNLVEILKRHGMRDVSELMVVAQALDEADRVYTPLTKSKSGGGKDRGWDQALYGAVRSELLSELARGAGGDGYEKRCKRLRILLDWIGGVPMQEIESGYSANPYNAVSLGTVRGFADGTRFHLRSTAEIVRAIFPGQKFPDQEFDLLLARLELGLPAALLELGRALDFLTREELLALSGIGVTSVAAISGATDAALLATLGNTARVQRVRKALQERAMPVAA